jgi:ribosomal protein L11 methyltransferase
MPDKSTSSWIQLTLESVDHTPEQLENALLRANALVVSFQDAGDQPVLEPLPGQTPLWPHVRVTGLFAAHADMESTRQTLRQTLSCAHLPGYHVEILEDRDWVRAWMDDAHPLRFGARLWIHPRNQPPPDPEAVNLRLDPGLAFGTGTHPTTAMCLEWLDGAELTDKLIVDYGCGSGILAIAALKLGAHHAWGVDIDAQALLASRDNGEHNDVLTHLTVCSPQDLPSVRADVVLANILSDPLIQLAPRFGGLVRIGGDLVLSGLLENQAPSVRAAFDPWFTFHPGRGQDGWTLLHASRKSH